MRVGIDFGTSYSSAAYLRDGHPMAVKPMKGQSPSVPSIVAISPQGELQVGHSAAHARADRSISEFKQYLGDDEWPLLLAGRELRPAELVTRLLAFLRDATPTADGPPDAAVLTVPASYGPHRRELMRLAGQAAGFADVDILEEPIAAAHYYAREGGLQAKDGDLLVVYDLGGGTFDIALVQAAHGGYETIGYAGLPDCGGIDFDTCLYEDIKRRCQRSRELLDADTDNAGHDARLAVLQMRLAIRQFCRDFKQLLSELEEHDGMVPNVFPPEEYRLTRGEFEKMITPLIDETVELSEGLMRDAELDWKQISAVLMVGGSCRIPYIRRRLEQLNPHVLQVDELDLAVAYGAAIYGQQLDQHDSAQLAARYAQGRRAEQERDWPGAVAHYQAVSDAQPGYRDVAERLAESARRRDIAALQKQLRALFVAGEFQDVIGIADRLAELDPAAADPDGVTTQARQRLQQRKQPDPDTSTTQILKGRGGPRLAHTLTGHTKGLYGVVFSPDGRLLASCGSDKTVRLWDPATGEHQRTLTGHTKGLYGVVFSPGGRLLASCGSDKTVRLWDPATGEHQRTLTGHTGWVRGVVFSPGGRLLASCGDDKTVRLWDPATGEHQRTLTGHTGWVRGVAFNPGGRLLASCGDDKTVRLWDPATGEHQRTLTGHTKGLYGVVFSPGGRLLASCGDDKTVRLWDPATGEHQRTLTGHTGAIRGVAFSPDGRLLASCGEDKTVRLWDHATGEHQLILTGRKGAVFRYVWGVAFSPDGRLLASCGEDKTVRLWDLQGGGKKRWRRSRKPSPSAASWPGPAPTRSGPFSPHR